MMRPSEATVALGGIGLSIIGNAVLGAIEGSIAWRLVIGAIVTLIFTVSFLLTCLIVRSKTPIAALWFIAINAAIFFAMWIIYTAFFGSVSVSLVDVRLALSSGWQFGWITITAFAVMRLGRWVTASRVDQTSEVVGRA